MAVCEKCWADAVLYVTLANEGSQADHYYALLEEREGNPCSPREQVGEFWDETRQCDRRLFITGIEEGGELNG